MTPEDAAEQQRRRCELRREVELRFHAEMVACVRLMLTHVLLPAAALTSTSMSIILPLRIDDNPSSGFLRRRYHPGPQCGQPHRLRSHPRSLRRLRQDAR